MPESLTKTAKLDVEYVIGVDCPLFTQTKGSQRFYAIGVDGSVPRVDSYCSICGGRARIVPDNDRFPEAILPKECKKDKTVLDKIADLVARIPMLKSEVQTTPQDWEKIR